jgi:hypothetical protein
MRLDDVCAMFSRLRFPLLGEDAHPDRESIVQVRSSIRDGLETNELLLDCIGRELQFIENSRLRRGLMSFFVAPDHGVRFAFAYWQPGETTGPHEHTAWSVSAVCHNRLEISTYDRAESYRRGELVSKNLYQAGPGQVGYIPGPAIHSVRNPTTDWSVSLHLSSARDGEPVNDAGPLPGLRILPPSWAQPPDASHPSAWVARARQRRQEADLLARMLLDMDASRTRELLASCASFASSAMRQTLRCVLPEPPAACAPPRRLARVHPDVRLELRRDGDECVLLVDTPQGLVETLRVDGFAYTALAAVSTSIELDTRQLPGDLGDDERAAVADMLHDLGLFRRQDV